MSAKEPTSVRLVASLGAAGLVSGLLLVGVHLFTRPYIERNRAEFLEKAIYQVLPGTSETATLAVSGGALRPWDGQPGPELLYTGRRDDGTFAGFAVVGEGNGFQDTIQLIYGFDPERRVITGMTVLESRETPGLGDKIIVDEDFLENFEALAVEPAIVLVKNGTKTRDNEVDGITGATISSEAVVAILNRSSEHWLPLIDATPDDTTPVTDADGGGR
ncbi:MAG: FMN-binding protein [bacterium]|nr:FMN-binding protein [bacterium]